MYLAHGIRWTQANDCSSVSVIFIEQNVIRVEVFDFSPRPPHPVDSFHRGGADRHRHGREGFGCVDVPVRCAERLEGVQPLTLTT